MRPLDLVLQAHTPTIYQHIKKKEENKYAMMDQIDNWKKWDTIWNNYRIWNFERNSRS